MELEPKLRVAAQEDWQQQHDHVTAQGYGKPYTQCASEVFGRLTPLTVQLVNLPQDFAAAPVDSLAVLGQAELARGAKEKLNLKLFLQLSDATAYGGRRQIQGPRSFSEAARIHSSHQ